MKKIDIIKIMKFIMYIILIIPFFKPRYLIYGPVNYNTYFTLLLGVALVVIIFLVIIKKKIKKNFFVIVLYFIVLLISTSINNGDMNNAISTAIQVLTFILVVDYGLKYDTKIFLNAVDLLLYMLVIYNLYTIFMYPNGMYIDSSGYLDNWFLGFKNVHILVILPAITFDFINSYYKYGKLKWWNYFFLIISWISVIIVNSSTSIIGLTAVSAFIIFNKLFNKTRILNIKNYTVAYIISFFGIIILRVQNLISFIVVDILKKDLTFTNRVYIWDGVMRLISDKPLLGYGVETSATRMTRIPEQLSLHAHNQILEIIYKSGFIGFTIFVYIVYLAYKELMKYKETIISKFLSIVMFAWMIMMLTEAYAYEYFMYFFVICFNIGNLVKTRKDENINEESYSNNSNI